jgi:hypothetical protein
MLLLKLNTDLLIGELKIVIRSKISALDPYLQFHLFLLHHKFSTVFFTLLLTIYNHTEKELAF